MEVRAEEEKRLLACCEKRLQDLQARQQQARGVADSLERRAETAEARASCMEQRAAGAEEKQYSFSVREAEAVGKVAVLQKLADQLAGDQERILAAEQRASRAEAQAEISQDVFEKMGLLVKEVIALQRSNSLSPRAAMFEPVTIKLEPLEGPQDVGAVCARPVAPTAADAAAAIAAADAAGMTPRAQDSVKRKLGFSFFG